MSTATPKRRVKHEPDVSARARYFRVLADPTRLAIIELLRDAELSVSDIVEAIGVPPSRVSNHLACLKWCKFVDADRRGRQVFYRLADDRVSDLIDQTDTLSVEQCDHLA